MLVKVKGHKLNTTKLTAKQRKETLIKRNSGKDLILSDRTYATEYEDNDIVEHERWYKFLIGDEQYSLLKKEKDEMDANSLQRVIEKKKVDINQEIANVKRKWEIIDLMNKRFDELKKQFILIKEAKDSQ